MTTTDEEPSKSHSGGEDHHDQKPTRPRLYSRPVQREKWGKPQGHQHTNWGDILFDLFYVAAAYNLGGLIVAGFDEVDSAESLRVFVYTIGTFGPIWLTWYQKFNYYSKIEANDYFHRALEVVRIASVALAIAHLKSPQELTNAASKYMLMFIMGILLECALSLIFWIEVLFFGSGGPEMTREAGLYILTGLMPIFGTYVTAAIIAFQNYDSAKSLKSYGGYRFLGAAAAEESVYVQSDEPIWLCAGAYGFYMIVLVLWGWVFRRESSTLERYRLPINADFAVHRFGEWTMLMLGESVLSLLIVEIPIEGESNEYYQIIIFGVVTVVLLQNLVRQSLILKYH